MLLETGIPTEEDLKKVIPSLETLKKGPIAIFECYQHIPCNPCHNACPTGAILPFEDLNDLPLLNEDKCTGCGICMSKCPGLAISILDYTYSKSQALMKLAYEFLPLPEVGEVVMALDRSGQDLCEAHVVAVVNSQKFDKTPLISIAFDKAYIRQVRHIKLFGGLHG